MFGIHIGLNFKDKAAEFWFANQNLSRLGACFLGAGGPIFGTAPVVDQGLLPESQLLGVSGQTIRPKYLLCLGLSGAMGHLLGIGEGTTVFAINQDPKAAIFRHAHVHWVIDIKLALGHISSWLKQVTVSASAALTT